MKRPLGITIVAVMLVCMSVGALILAMTAETLAATGDRWRLVQVGTLLYSVAAAVAAFGLWKLRRWGYVAFVGWVATVLAIGLWWPASFPRFTLPQWAAWLWIAVVAAIMLPLGRYVRRAIAGAHRPVDAD